MTEENMPQAEAPMPEPHFPEPRPCGNYLCDQDHDGPCWTCGEQWPCTNERQTR